MVVLNRGWRSSKVFIYIVVNLAVFTDAYFYGVIIPVLPFALTEVIGVDKNDVQWWIGGLLAAYGAGLLVGSPIVGYYADRSGSRRGPYLLGLIFLAFSTIAISLGRSLGVLIVGRLVQGVSSASVHTVGIAILADAAGDHGIGPAMGLVTAMISLGAVLGPLFGGLLYHQFGYFAVFFSAYIILAADFVLRLLLVEKKKTSYSAMGNDSESYGTFTEVHHSEAAAKADRQNALHTADAASAKISEAITDTREEKKKAYPIVILLTTPRMLAAILCDFMQSLILTGLETVLPLRIKVKFHYNSQDVALVFLVLALPYTLGPLIGKIGDTYGAKALASTGFASLVPLLILLRLIDHYELELVALLCFLLFAIGTALGMVLTPTWSDTMYLVEAKTKDEPETFGTKGAYAQAFGLLNMAYALGSVLGPLVGGCLIEEVGWNQMTLGAGILCGICVIPCILYTGDRRPRKEPVVDE